MKSLTLCLAIYTVYVVILGISSQVAADQCGAYNLTMMESTKFGGREEFSRRVRERVPINNVFYQEDIAIQDAKVKNNRAACVEAFRQIINQCIEGKVTRAAIALYYTNTHDSELERHKLVHPDYIFWARATEFHRGLVSGYTPTVMLTFTVGNPEDKVVDVKISDKSLEIPVEYEFTIKLSNS